MNGKRSMIVAALVCVMFFLGILVGAYMEDVDAAPAEHPRIYELRTYTTNEGKLDDLHARFSNHTNGLFVKHGITLIGYWTHAEGDAADNTLVYLIAHEDRVSAKASWRTFGADEEWRRAYADSRKDGALVEKIESRYLIPTDYSPLR